AGYAAFQANGSTKPVVVNGITGGTGLNDGGGGTESPQYFISATNNTYVSIHSGIGYGVSDGIHDGGGNSHFVVSPNVLSGTGTVGSVTWNYAQGWNTDDGAQGTLKNGKLIFNETVADNVALSINNTTTNANVPIIDVTESVTTDRVLGSKI